MFRKSAQALTTLVMIAGLAPLSAHAGSSGPPDNTITVAPIFDTGNTSGMAVETASGFAVGYNLNGVGTAGVTGSDVLNQNPDYSAAVGGSLGWPDLDGNGISDFVRISSGGLLAATLLEDTGDFVSPISVDLIAQVPSGFTILGWPDLDGDGTNDLVIQDASGATVGYLITAGAISQFGQLPGLPATGGYRTIGFPDLDGVNGADLVIQSSSGFTYAYLLSGLTVTEQGQIPGAPVAGPWNTIGFPDLNGDGNADVAIQEAGGFTFAALMNGLVELSRSPIPGLPVDAASDYETIGFPDLDAQNGSDIVIQHISGYTHAFLMDGTNSLGGAQIPGLPVDAASDYETAGFPQLDGTSGADHVIRHTSGYTFGFLMDGTTSTSSGVLPSQAGGAFNVLGWENAWNVIPAPAL